MPIPSPFHERTSALCTSHRWKDWAGYLTVASYQCTHDAEYVAFRQSAGLFDATPLFKYEVRGPDAAAFLARMTVRDITRLKVGRVTYTCWCDDDGKVIDDGTISRLDADHFRVTAADPTFYWLERASAGYNVSIEDSSHTLAALALQGPTSRDILRQCSDADLDRLRFFRVTRARLGDHAVWISRTGYTGDLGYEIWMDNEAALGVWDALMDAGQAYDILPAGLDALDMTRIEAGFIMLDVDYHSSQKVVLESRRASPYEIGLDWTVDLDRAPFVGQKALRAELARGVAWKLVGLEASWEEIEALYDRQGLPPSLPAAACRDALPVYAGRKQVGRATSHTWSPTLKKPIALASVLAPHSALGTELKLEHTVEFSREVVTATVVETPFFNPERKRRP